MKSFALAVGLTATVMSVSVTFGSDQPSSYNADSGRYLYESDHVATNSSRSARAAMNKVRAERDPQVKAFSDAERALFNRSPGSEYRNCNGPTAWPCE